MGQISRVENYQSLLELEESSSKYLTFKLGGDVYAIEVMHIKKIIEFSKLTTIPMMPKFIRGIFNLLGTVVPVIDLAVCFGQGAVTVTKRTCIIIVEVNNRGKTIDMGMIVDAVHNVIELPAKDIAAAPTFGNDIRTNFIEGVGRVGDDFIMILNMNHILSGEDLSSLHRIQQQATQIVENEKFKETAVKEKKETA